MKIYLYFGYLNSKGVEAKDFNQYGTRRGNYEVALMYKNEGTPLIILAGKEYGSGSSRDWAAK